LAVGEVHAAEQDGSDETHETVLGALGQQRHEQAGEGCSEQSDGDS